MFRLDTNCTSYLHSPLIIALLLFPGYCEPSEAIEVRRLNCLDLQLPLWLGISVYVWFWPTKYLREDNRILPPTEAEVAHEYAGAAPSVLPDAVPMDRSMSSTTSKEAANGAIEEKRLQS
mgnify:CR=1 FL=1